MASMPTFLAEPHRSQSRDSSWPLTKSRLQLTYTDESKSYPPLLTAFMDSDTESLSRIRSGASFSAAPASFEILPRRSATGNSPRTSPRSERQTPQSLFSEVVPPFFLTPSLLLLLILVRLLLLLVVLPLLLFVRWW